jgi:hypothetical protein
MTTLRIFISSPGDVAEERAKARQVIEQLQRQNGSGLELIPVLWEDLPLQADSSSQEGIDMMLSKEHGIDITLRKIAQDGGPAWIPPETVLSGSRSIECLDWFAEPTRTRRPSGQAPIAPSLSSL